MVIIRYCLRIVGLVLIFAVLNPAWAAQINVQADRNEIDEGESFTLVFTSNESVDDDPNFGPLENDFTILGQDQSYNMQFINGTFSRSTRWTLTLIPKKTGSLQIPAIKFGKDSSKQFVVKVTKATQQNTADATEMFLLEVEANPKTAYVQSQIIYSVRIYHALTLSTASLSEVNVGDSDAIVEKLGEDITFEKKLNGRRYKVFEKRYAIYPQKSGKLTIEPILFEGRYADPRRSAPRSWPGLNSPRAFMTKQLQSNAVTIDVKPIPANYTGPWIPANKVELYEQWPKGQPKFTVGEPVTRVLTLKAEGALSSQLPLLHKAEITDIKQYTDQPVFENKKSNEGVVGYRQETIAMIPTKAGKFELPAIDVNWWNTTSNKLETVHLAARTIDVIPGQQSSISAPTAPVEQPSTVSPAETAPQTENKLDTESPVEVTKSSPYWIWTSGLLLCVWILTLVAWWLSARKRAQKPQQALAASDERDYSFKQTKKLVEKACKNNDPIGSKQGLLEWGKHAMPDILPTSLGQLSQFCDEPLRTEIRKLNSVLYSKTHDQWQGKELLLAFLKNNKKAASQTPMGSGSSIEPLHYKVAR